MSKILDTTHPSPYPIYVTVYGMSQILFTNPSSSLVYLCYSMVCPKYYLPPFPPPWPIYVTEWYVPNTIYHLLPSLFMLQYGMSQILLNTLSSSLVYLCYSMVCPKYY